MVSLCAREAGLTGSGYLGDRWVGRGLVTSGRDERPKIIGWEGSGTSRAAGSNGPRENTCERELGERGAAIMQDEEQLSGLSGEIGTSKNSWGSEECSQTAESRVSAYESSPGIMNPLPVWKTVTMARLALFPDETLSLPWCSRIALDPRCYPPPSDINTLTYSTRLW